MNARRTADVLSSVLGNCPPEGDFKQKDEAESKLKYKDTSLSEEKGG